MKTILLLALATTASAKERPPCVKVFVTTAGTPAGFTSPNKGTQDSSKDLVASLGHHKTVCVTPDREKAAIVLEVLGRWKTTTFDARRYSTVRVKFIFRDFETELSGSERSGWSDGWDEVADQIAEQVDRWVKDNRAKIDAPPN